MKKHEVKPILDLRYPSSPLCDCNLSAAIRVVDFCRKSSRGKLFYCCPHQRCLFLVSGGSLIYADGGEYNEVEEEAYYEDKVSMASVFRFGLFLHGLGFLGFAVAEGCDDDGCEVEGWKDGWKIDGWDNGRKDRTTAATLTALNEDCDHWKFVGT
ncbi:hypothetical protein CDL12_18462 [Handroanthus impetiginosus]|uniref:Uncharacterized protein n=1 Tax=Handroanthus impetiginosus TaxID=429701 RepID=A0A2G9GUI8_9LAMI|nr:hypothetical protein CDL12_18462 [Handroanthus impetiginosus]